METVIAVSACILVCIQAHRNYLMVMASRNKEDRAADALEKILQHLERDSYLQERNRMIEQRSRRRW